MIKDVINDNSIYIMLHNQELSKLIYYIIEAIGLLAKTVDPNLDIDNIKSLKNKNIIFVDTHSLVDQQELLKYHFRQIVLINTYGYYLQGIVSSDIIGKTIQINNDISISTIKEVLKELL